METVSGSRGQTTRKYQRGGTSGQRLVEHGEARAQRTGSRRALSAGRAGTQGRGRDEKAGGDRCDAAGRPGARAAPERGSDECGTLVQQIVSTAVESALGKRGL